MPAWTVRLATLLVATTNARAVAVAGCAASDGDGCEAGEDESFSTLQRARASAAGRLVTGSWANASRSPRYTQKGCQCDQTWSTPSSPDHPCMNYCCNPDNDPGGPWCITDKSCQGVNWGTCAAIGDEPTPSVSTSGRAEDLQSPAVDKVPKTTSGCECQEYWIYASAPEQPCESYCCNPENDPGGPWCITVERCNGMNWGSCADVLQNIPTEAPAPPEPSTTTTTTRVGGTPRVTTSGCACSYSWIPANPDGSEGEHCENYCCNPDDDPNGDWCITKEPCNGLNWGTCAPIQQGVSSTPPAVVTPAPRFDLPPTPLPTSAPTAPPAPSDFALVVSWALTLQELSRAMRVEGYPGTNQDRTLRRCSTFQLTVKRVPSSVRVANPSAAASLLAARDEPANKPGVVARPEAPDNEDLSSGPIESYPPLQEAHDEQRDKLNSSAANDGPDKIDCKVDTESQEACSTRAEELEAEQREINAECGLPDGVPIEAAMSLSFCSNAAPECEELQAQQEECIARRKPIDAEIKGCMGCVARSTLVQQGVAVDKPTMGPPREKATLTKEQAGREAAGRQRKLAAKRRRQRMWMERQQAAMFSGLLQASAVQHKKASLEALQSRAQLAQAADSWPLRLPVTFEPDQVSWSDPSEELEWEAKQSTSCATGDDHCAYVVTIPCNGVVGGGVLKAGFAGHTGQLLISNVAVLFNPYAEEDDTYFGSFSGAQQEAYLNEDVMGIWQGEAKQYYPKKWSAAPHDPAIVQGVMKLMTHIPVGQRGEAPRVARWLSYLVNRHVIAGSWTPPYSDGTEPWAWDGSKAIFEEWLQSGSKVRYAQCWVFAGTLVSMTRAIGLPSLVVTNFNSAHGKRPYNKGIDTFWEYGDNFELKLLELSQMREESVWNFHVWNQVWMRRPDLEGGYDGWQAIDATPQERTCEMEGSVEVCIYELGPTPVKAVYEDTVSTPGNETPYHALKAGLSYDSLFVYGESRGALRGWKPAALNFQHCPASCVPNYRGDGYCDEACNNAECDYDMGDCCEDTCLRSTNGVVPIRRYDCGSNGYDKCIGHGKGWTINFNNTHHVGSVMTTGKPGGSWNQVEIITGQYKPL